MKTQSMFLAFVLGALVQLTSLHSAVPAASRDFIIGVPNGYTPGTAPLVAIDPETGLYTTLNTSGNSYSSLAEDSNGMLYAGSFDVSSEHGRVSRINPSTGAAIDTYDAVTPGTGDIRGLSFDHTDRLFAVVNRNDGQGAPTLADDLYLIDLASETTSLIGSLGFAGVQGLDCSPAGTLYAWDVTAGLLLVDPVTGTATDVNPGIGGTAGIQSIVFAPDGRLFGARQQLFSINPATGAFSPIGFVVGPDVRGIEWISVPEPTAAVLIVSCMVLINLRTSRSLRSAKAPAGVSE